MAENHIQMPADHRRLIGRQRLVIAAQLKKALKPETEIPALHVTLDVQPPAL
jgi:hypothetical protein